jgi:hypothetical protein
MYQYKTPKYKTRRERRVKQPSPKIVATQFVHVDTLIKEYSKAK